LVFVDRTGRWPRCFGNAQLALGRLFWCSDRELSDQPLAAGAGSPFDGQETAYFYFEVHAGTRYHIVVAQSGTDAPFTLNLDFLPKPANDDFQHRVVIPGRGGSATVDTFSATFQPGEPVDLASDVVGWTASWQTVWWTWTAPVGGRVTIQPSGDFLYLLGIYQALT
jgi:hypothetical protein